MSDPDPPYFTPLKTRTTMKRPHNCNYGCGKAFPRPYSQRKHHVLYHPDLHLMQNNSVYCKICFEIFKDNTELTEHTDVQHNNSKQDQQLQCEVGYDLSFLTVASFQNWPNILRLTIFFHRNVENNLK